MSNRARIEHVDMPAGELIGPVHMDRLGPTVVLAGPNGAGKTRLLAAIARATSDAGMAAHISPRPDEVVHIFPMRTKLEDHSQLPQDQSLRRADDAARSNGSELSAVALAYIQQLQQRWVEANSPSGSLPAHHVPSARGNYEQFQELVEGLLGARLGRKVGAPTIFGRPIQDAKLSEGQSVLLQVAVLLSRQKQRFDQGLLMLMDEPEAHLHPSALVEVFDRLRKLNARGQIWVATHSVDILAAVDRDAIWFVDRGVVKHAGRTPEKVLYGLIGSDEQRAKLAQFLDLPAQLAQSRFAAECLVPPPALDGAEGDPQVAQIREMVATCRGEGSPVRVLDYGAGRGRLLAGLLENSTREELAEAVDYYATDKDDTHREACVEVLKTVYGNAGPQRYIQASALDSLPSEIDVVVLCNALHEIPPKLWPDVLAGAAIKSKLNASGYFLSVEDYWIPRGELAHPAGFLLLDTEELKVLFQCTASDWERCRVASERDGRLKAHLIPSEFAARVSVSSIRGAITHLRDRARVEIRSRRSNIAEASFLDGLHHARWCQLLVNADLALEDYAE